MVSKILKCVKKRKKTFIIVSLIISSATILHTKWSPDLDFLHWEPDDTSCYVRTDEDALSVIKDNFSPPAKSIYFHETSCKGGLNSRQACSVESAARAHPSWQINLFFVGPVMKETLHIGSLKALRNYTNVKFMRLHLNKYAIGTPLERFVSSGALNRTRWRIIYTSDALRFLSLYKWGGVYLDLDVIVAKSFEELAPNWSARESNTAVSAGAFAFSKDKLGRSIAATALRDFQDNFRGDIWGQTGPGVMTRILEKMCNTYKIVDMTRIKCQGFEVYGPEVFYPVSWKKAKDYFDTSEHNWGQPHAYHVWNKITEQYTVEKGSTYVKLAQKFCPRVYEQYGENFGL